jgi:hypothetical protein
MQNAGRPTRFRSHVAALRALVLLAATAAAPRAAADSRKVYVMPIDGPVDGATRDRLNASLHNLARGLGTVTTASATFAETASMVGCDPAAAACANTVLATLQADEIVWGTATPSADGGTQLVVHRATKGGAPHQDTAAIAPNESPEKVETTMRPFFGGAASTAGTGARPAAPPNGGAVPSTGSGSTSVAATTAGSETGSAAETRTATAAKPAGSSEPSATAPGGSGAGTAASQPNGAHGTETGSTVTWSRDKKLGIGLAIGGGAALVIGFALWASESSVQSQIDAAPTATLSEIAAVKSLEGTANGYAWAGNVMVVVGAVAGGAGAYYLWKDHKAHVTMVAATPIDHGTGGAFVIGGRW